MRSSVINLVTCILFVSAASIAPAQPAPAKPKRTVIAADVILDGRGGMLRNTRIVIEGSKIIAIDPKAGPVNYNLRGLTVLPGWIDSHVHITWSFDEDGKNAGSELTSQAAAYQAASNAWLTLMAGFTTVQSVGSPTDIPLRDAIARGSLPGPRILTSVQPLFGRNDEAVSVEDIRGFVRKQKEAGADVIKIFASNSINRPELMFSPEQLNAACDEARKLGLRTLVHAYKDAVRAASVAGCTQVEHGPLATDDDLRLLAKNGTYLDPQSSLVWKNYMQNQDRFIGTPGYPKEVFAVMPKLLTVYQEFMKRALKIPGLKIVFGSDSLAGSHGRNAEEFIDRVQEVGADPMTALVSANSLAAEALGMSDQIGSIIAGLEADIIAIDGNPLRDITAVRRVVFVMKGGVVYKNSARR